MPYGKSFISIEITKENFDNFKDIIEISPKYVRGLTNPIKSFINSLNNPVSSNSLKEIIKKKKKGGKIAVVVDDHTRKFPNKLIIPPFLKYCEDSGVKKEEMVFIVASSTHKAPTQEQMNKLFGNILQGYRIEISNQKNGKFKKVGITSRGTPVLINNIYLNADIRILLTDITMHYFAGFGGDRKSILPGVAGQESVDANHKMATRFGSRTGNLKGNPVHEDMLEAAQMVGANFVVNLCMNDQNEMFYVKSGALNSAFLEATAEYKKSFTVNLKEQADLLILSQGGYPQDINYYQSMKSMHQCRSAVKKGGKILFFTECGEGIGSSVFKDWINKFKTADEVAREIERNFKQGANSAFYQYKFIERNQIFIKSEMSDDFVKNTLKMTPVHNVRQMTDKLIKEAEKVCIVRNGSKILIDVNLA
ncbi:MAG: nickel-dependent lactate racemase [Promethearchaeota archaeon]